MTSSAARRQPADGLGRLGRFAVNVALVAVTLVAAAYLVPGLLGYDRYVITGGSMSGTFEKGAIAFERQVPVSSLEVGDVITYQPPADSGVANLVTHRIVKARTTTEGVRVFRTKGDANADPDPWTFSLVDKSQPVVQFTVPWLGHVLIALADRDTRMVAVGAPAALIALASLVELVKALRGFAGRTRPRTFASRLRHTARV